MLRTCSLSWFCMTSSCCLHNFVIYNRIHKELESRVQIEDLCVPWKISNGIFEIIYKNSVRTSQETHYVSTTKPKRLMLFRETVAVYCENHTKHTDTLLGRLQGFSVLKQVVLWPLGFKSLCSFYEPSNSRHRLLLLLKSSSVP
jgi:hypothetical protein